MSDELMKDLRGLLTDLDRCATQSALNAVQVEGEERERMIAKHRVWLDTARTLRNIIERHERPEPTAPPEDPWAPVGPVETVYGVARWSNGRGGLMLHVDGYSGINHIAAIDADGGWYAYNGPAGERGSAAHGTWTGAPASYLPAVYAALRECGTLPASDK